jgi:hypothetical protein
VAVLRDSDQNSYLLFRFKGMLARFRTAMKVFAVRRTADVLDLCESSGEVGNCAESRVRDSTTHGDLEYFLQSWFVLAKFSVLDASFK